MKPIEDLIAAVAFAVAALMTFRIPVIFHNEDLDGSISYTIMAGAFLYFMYVYKLPTLAYLRFPKVSISSALGLAVVAFFSYAELAQDEIITKPLWPTVSGVFYLFAIGLGEELVARGFIFGVLKKHGNIFALLMSSLLFGLMHLNLYLGSDWDPVHAYWHCLSAAGFGFLAASVMIVTRSIYPAVILHALTDWSVVFTKPYQGDDSTGVEHFDSFWTTLGDSFWFVMPHLFAGLALLTLYWISKHKRVPKRLEKAFLKLGLIQEITEQPNVLDDLESTRRPRSQ